MNIRAFKQGELDRLCSLYALINAVRSTGFKLTRLQMQAVVDDIIENLSSDDLKALMLGGAEHKEVMKLAHRLNKVFHDVYDKQIEVMRPYRHKTPDFETVLFDMEHERSCNSGVIVRFFSNTLDHYSVFDRIEAERIKLIDSAHIASLLLKEVSVGYRTRYTLRTDGIYYLRLLNLN